MFLLALIISAWMIPELRLLHIFQALPYLAMMVLTRKKSPWGFGLAVFMAATWNGISLFVSRLMQAGAAQLLHFVRTGRANQPDTLVVLFGGLAHFLLIAAALVGFLYLRPGLKQWAQFFGGGFLGVGYFALIVATMAPH